MLLQILDDGKLTDSKGRVVNFKNTVIIMTSNIGSTYINKMEKMGFASDESSDNQKYINMKDKVMDSLKDNFRPEFLNRVDEIIIFNILSRKAVEEIVGIQIREVTRRLSAKEVSLEISPQALKELALKGYDPSYGARPLKRMIQSKILTPIASMMISNNVSSGGKVLIDFKGKDFIFNSEKGKLHSKDTVKKAKSLKGKEKVVV